MDREIIEGNRLIAEFMGLETDLFDGSLIVSSDKGKSWCGKLYDADWSQLMSVVEKIQSIDITPPPNYKGYRIEIVVQGYVKIEGFPMPPIFTNVSGAGSLIKAVWYAVVQFIQWYNTQPQGGKK